MTTPNEQEKANTNKLIAEFMGFDYERKLPGQEYRDYWYDQAGLSL